MAEAIEELEGKPLLFFADGKWNRRPYSPEEVALLVENTRKQGVDVPVYKEHPTIFGRTDNDAQAWVKPDEIGKREDGTFGAPWRRMSGWLKEKITSRALRYISPEVRFPNHEAQQEHNLTEAYISGLVAVADPAIRPQAPLIGLASDTPTEYLTPDEFLETNVTITTGPPVTYTLTLNGQPCEITEVLAKQAKLGSGKRFAKLAKKLARQGIKNPAALAAKIGRKKYGARRFAKIAAAARKRKKRS